MPSAIAFIRWENYRSGRDGSGLFSSMPLSFSSRQERLHHLRPGDALWLVSRAPDDQQYYFVAVLEISGISWNDTCSTMGREFGPFCVLADGEASCDFARAFPAEGLLRACSFESTNPIKFGATIGQSLQTVRFLSDRDERALARARGKVLSEDKELLESPFGLWTKCDIVFADYFLTNWRQRRQPVAFLLFDSKPALPANSPVFIHSERRLRIIGRFQQSQYVSGHKYTVEEEERISERERIWSLYRAHTEDPPDKREFDEFWENQNGVRALFLMDELIEVPKALQFKDYGRALQWGYPRGVGFRYLTLTQSLHLLNLSGLGERAGEPFLNALLR